MVRRVFATGLASALLLASGEAGASSYYPASIQTHLGVTCTPDTVLGSSTQACLICHNNTAGGIGTVVTRFGHTMVMLGLVAQSQNSLFRALDQEKSAGTDVDFDGDTDIAALMACRDPNVPDFGDAGGDGSLANSYVPPSDPIPEYGCSLLRPSARRVRVGASWGFLVAAFALLRRRARRR